MKLEDIPWTDNHLGDAKSWVFHNGSIWFIGGAYYIGTRDGEWLNLDPATAQAVLYHVLGSEPVATDTSSSTSSNTVAPQASSG